MLDTLDRDLINILDYVLRRSNAPSAGLSSSLWMIDAGPALRVIASNWSRDSAK